MCLDIFEHTQILRAIHLNVDYFIKIQFRLIFEILIIFVCNVDYLDNLLFVWCTEEGTLIVCMQ